MPIASHFIPSTTTNWGLFFSFSGFIWGAKTICQLVWFYFGSEFLQFGVSQPIRDCVTFQFRFYCRAAAHFVLIVKRFRGNHTKNFSLSLPTRWDQRNARFMGREKIFFTFAGCINLRTSLARFMPSGTMKYIACDSWTWLAKAARSLPWPSFFTASQLFTDKYLLESVSFE